VVCQTSFAQRSRNEVVRVCEWGGWARAAALVEGVGGRPSPRIPLEKAVKRFVSGRAGRRDGRKTGGGWCDGRRCKMPHRGKGTRTLRYRAQGTRQDEALHARVMLSTGKY
jgi:hypothetical protein